MGMRYAIVMMTALMQSASSTKCEDFFINHAEGPCVLRDVESLQLDGEKRGFRIWFGDRLHLKLAYFVTDGFSGAGPKRIVQSGNISKASFAEESSYFELYSAFLDEKLNLIACEGGGPPFLKLPVRQIRPVCGFPMPIPVGLHERIRFYKMVYYESSVPIKNGKPQGQEVDPSSDDSILGRENENEGNPSLLIRQGSRLLNLERQEGWLAETTEGFCSLKELKAKKKKLDESPKVELPLGKALTTNVRCHLTIDESRFVNAWVSYNNMTEKKKYVQFYLALFDKKGSLVCCVNYPNKSLDPNSSSPKITFENRPLTDSFEAYRLMEIPEGFEDSITAYKITVYESERPIGDLKAVNKATKSEDIPANNR